MVQCPLLAHSGLEWASNMDTKTVDLIGAWHDLYVMLGSSTAALIGLLFVAVSIHLGEALHPPGGRMQRR